MSYAEQLPPHLRLCGMLGLIGSIGVVLADLIGILVYQPYDPVSQTISALAAGRFAWIQDLGLYLLALGMAAVALGLLVWKHDTWRWTAGCILMLLLAADLVVIAAVNEYAGTRNIGADTHTYALYALYFLAALIPLCLASRLGRLMPALGWGSIVAGAGWIVLAPIYSFVPTGWDGAYERMLALLGTAWLAALSLVLMRGAGPGGGR